MNYLLDTCVVLWSITENKARLKKIIPLYKDTSNSFFVSVISLFEISVKKTLGKLEIAENYESKIEESGFLMLDLRPEHIRILDKLPLHHKDPFDRLLIAQAKAENMKLLTEDKYIELYF